MTHSPSPASSVLIEPDLLLISQLVQRCQTRLGMFVEAPPLQVTHPARLHTTISIVDARARLLEVVFKTHAVEVWLSEHAKPVFLERAIARATAANELLTLIWRYVLVHFVNPKHTLMHDGQTTTERK